MQGKNKEFGDYFSNLLLEKEPRTHQYKVAEKFGVQQGTLSKIKTGAMIPSDDLAEKIINEWNLDREEFMGYIYKARQESGAKFFREAQQRTDYSENIVTTKPRIPITAEAGQLAEYLGGVLANECEQLPIIRSIPDYDFTMFVKGNSMEPKYESGDEIACKKVESVIEWGKAYVLATRDGAVLKRLFPAEHGFRCVSYNHDEYPDFIVDEDDVFGKYRVVGLIRI